MHTILAAIRRIFRPSADRAVAGLHKALSDLNAVAQHEVAEAERHLAAVDRHLAASNENKARHDHATRIARRLADLLS